MKKILWGVLVVLLAGTVQFAWGDDLIVTGKLGVGTSGTPNSKIDVIANEYGWATQITNNGATNAHGLYVNIGSSSTGIPFRVDKGGSALFAVENGGNVGIGSPSPVCKLEVLGNIWSNNYTLISHNGANNIVLSSTDNYGTIQNDDANKWSLGYAGTPSGLGNPVLTWTSGGNVSIGTTDPQPYYKLYVAGTAHFTGVSGTSDMRFKESLMPIDSPLNKIMNIEGVSFAWKREEYKDKGFPEGRHYGVIAQEIEKVLPEVVNTSADGEKAVAYTELVPVLIEAMKEQQKVIEKQNKAIEALQTAVEQLKGVR